MKQYNSVSEAWADLKQSFNFAKNSIKRYILKKTYKQIIWVFYSYKIEKTNRNQWKSSLTPRWLWRKLVGLKPIVSTVNIDYVKGNNNGH